jgi:hypothetical protein
MQLHRAPTSIDILNERNALRERVEELEAALRSVERETSHALEHPSLSLLTICRIGNIAARAAEGTSASTPRPGLVRCDGDEAPPSGVSLRGGDRRRAR